MENHVAPPNALQLWSRGREARKVVAHRLMENSATPFAQQRVYCLWTVWGDKCPVTPTAEGIEGLLASLGWCTLMTVGPGCDWQTPRRGGTIESCGKVAVWLDSLPSSRRFGYYVEAFPPQS